LKQLNFPRTIFIDRGFGGYRLAAILRKVGFEVRAHKECSWLNSDVDDDVWIPDVTSRGWVILSSDKRISRDPVNVRAVLDSKAQVIMTSDNNILPEFWGAAFMVGRIKIHEVLNSNPGPVYIQMSHCTGNHVQVVRQAVTHPRPSLPPTSVPVRQAKPAKPDFSHIKF
jgi:hypothetical protein